MIARLAHSSAAHMLGAFMVMGLWTYVANRTHELAAALPAALLQGLLSAGMTLILKTMVERLAPRFAGPVRLCAPPFLTAFALTSILAFFHSVAGTPELLATLALPVAAATGYAAIYNYALWKEL